MWRYCPPHPVRKERYHQLRQLVVGPLLNLVLRLRQLVREQARQLFCFRQRLQERQCVCFRLQGLERISVCFRQRFPLQRCPIKLQARIRQLDSPPQLFGFKCTSIIIAKRPPIQHPCLQRPPLQHSSPIFQPSLQHPLFQRPRFQHPLHSSLQRPPHQHPCIQRPTYLSPR